MARISFAKKERSVAYGVGDDGPTALNALLFWYKPWTLSKKQDVAEMFFGMDDDERAKLKKAPLSFTQKTQITIKVMNEIFERSTGATPEAIQALIDDEHVYDDACREADELQLASENSEEFQLCGTDKLLSELCEKSPDDFFPRLCEMLNEVISAKKAEDLERGNASSSGASTETLEESELTSNTSSTGTEQATDPTPQESVPS